LQLVKSFTRLPYVKHPISNYVPATARRLNLITESSSDVYRASIGTIEHNALIRGMILEKSAILCSNICITTFGRVGSLDVIFAAQRIIAMSYIKIRVLVFREKNCMV
jgi:hypothetical protein